MFLSRLVLASCLLLASLPARADLILQAPQDPIVAGREFVLTLVVANPAAEPLAVPALPAAFPVVARHGTRAVSAVFHVEEPRRSEAGPLAPGAFRRVSLRGSLPADIVGLVVLDATAHAAGRVAVEIAPATPAVVAGAAAPEPAAAQAPAAPAVFRREFGLSPHEPVYFSIGANGGINARFQLSFKFRPIGPSDDRIAGRGFWEDVYMSFTQTSLWDLHSTSKPFTDSSYRPALFFHRYDTGAAFLGGRLGLAAGFEHESNGKAAADSRSINILFARPTVRWGASDGWQFVVSPKLYWYLDKEENDDIQRFRGYGDFLFALEHPRSWKLAATLRAGTSGRGSVLVDATYPFAKVNDFVPLGLVHGYLHLQFFEGWGESLLHYDERAETQFRIGFMAIR
ncbi:MAG TPA: phospholipase A [Opitutaceae bacterium]|nr:phospholipase A [Opitutaceae bacterium]